MVKLSFPGVSVAYNISRNSTKTNKKSVHAFKQQHKRNIYNCPPCIEDCDLVLLEKLANFFYKHKRTWSEMLFSYSRRSITLYTNSVKILNELYKISSSISATEIVLPSEGKLHFQKDPKFKHRIYFKNKRVTTETREAIHTFVKNNMDNTEISMSRGLCNFCRGGSHYINSGYHVNFNDESMLSYMNLMFSECLGKLYSLEKK